jgi:3-hydroxyisobutyrate dehydrogenase-like beta-hydroxyacid dehydrogenase
MEIGFFGRSRLAAAATRRLGGTHPVRVFAQGAGAAGGTRLADAARDCDVVLVCAESPADAHEVMLGAHGIADGLRAGSVVVDLTPGDPEQTLALAAVLKPKGIVLVDAPIQCEQVDALPDASAILCGAPPETLERVRPLLETICPNVVHCGDVGQGQAARLIVAAVAACNRLITYEGAAMGLKNGLAVADMATVLSRCSGSSSGVTRVLPALVERRRTADVPLASVVHDLAGAMRLGMACGAPMMISNVVHGLLLAAAADLGPPASLDDVSTIIENGARIKFAGNPA